MEPVKVGVIGAGYWGPNLVRNFYQLPEAQLIWVCDLQADRLETIRQNFPGVCTTQDYRDLLGSDLDAVAIATPVSTHYPLAMHGLRAGKHLLVEKPLATSSAEARRILHAARQRRRLVMTGHTFLFNPAVVALKDLVARGEIGRVYYVDSTRANLGLYRPDVDVLWDLAPHDVSILLYVLGLEPLAASARGGAFVRPGVHDVAHLTLHFPGGILADLRLSWLDPCKVRRLILAGSRKMLVYDDLALREKLLIYDKGVEARPCNSDGSDGVAGFYLDYRQGEPSPYPLDWEEPLQVECRQFLECVRTGSPPRSDALLGLKVVQVLEAAQKSLLNGGHRQPVHCDSDQEIDP